MAAADDGNDDETDDEDTVYDPENDSNALNLAGNRTDLAIRLDQKRKAVKYAVAPNGSRRRLSSIQKKFKFVKSYIQLRRWKKQIEGHTTSVIPYMIVFYLSNMTDICVFLFTVQPVEVNSTNGDKLTNTRCNTSTI